MAHNDDLEMIANERELELSEFTCPVPCADYVCFGECDHFDGLDSSELD